MKKIIINSFEDYLSQIEILVSPGKEYNLYRGQAVDKPLLPAIARVDPEINNVLCEQKMLKELKRRSALLIHKEYNEWDLLVLAQHFGMNTRMLDWSSNPLIALWFACREKGNEKNPCFVYVFQADDSIVVDSNEVTSPFTPRKTKILRPLLNNERIIAQSGWFTVHNYSEGFKTFVSLETNKDHIGSVTKLVIPSHLKKSIIKKLSTFGINNRTVFPDIEGLCRHMNWKYLSDQPILQSVF